MKRIWFFLIVILIFLIWQVPVQASVSDETIEEIIEDEIEDEIEIEVTTSDNSINENTASENDVSENIINEENTNVSEDSIVEGDIDWSYVNAIGCIMIFGIGFIGGILLSKEVLKWLN